MRHILKILIDLPKKYSNKIIAYLQFEKDYRQFENLLKKSKKRFSMSRLDIYPCLNDKIPNTTFDRHYVYHPAWAARILAKTKPPLHVDISSTLYFCSFVSAFIPFKFYDYRPTALNLSNLTTGSADLLSLPFEDNSIKSLSCMQVVEHIGLGRYGDVLDPDSDLKAISELKRVMSDEGDLLLVVPVGGLPKILFNAHRIYSYDQVMEYFSDFHLREFVLISDKPDVDGMIYNASKEMVNECHYGCGCFWFKRESN